MCDDCVLAGTYYGEVIPGIRLFQATKTVEHFNIVEGQWYLSDGGDYVIGTFPTPPEPEPEVSEDEEERNTDQYDRWFDWERGAGPFADSFLLPPEKGEHVMRVCREAGWDQDEYGYVSLWLYHMSGVRRHRGVEEQV